MTFVPLADWYPSIHRLWLDRGRRLTVALADRTGYTVHHTAGGAGIDEHRYARQVADMHFAKWSRPGGYNFQVGVAGTVFEMCGWQHVGAHAPGCNFATIGVSFQGSFASTMPNAAQLAAFAQLVGEGLVPRRQQGHRDCSSTSCPGDRLYRALPLTVAQLLEEATMPVRLIHLDARGGTAYLPDAPTRSLVPLNARWQADALTGDDDWPRNTVVVSSRDVESAGWKVRSTSRITRSDVKAAVVGALGGAGAVSAVQVVDELARRLGG